MAIDEVLLRTTRFALMRFYRWREPSASFGYFDRFDEAEQFAAGRPLVRRWTGGGIVPHGDDLTYSIIIPATEAAYRISSPELYRLIHESIAAVLRSNGVESDLVSTSAPRVSAACFANPVTADLVEGERKIAGAAHRKTRHGLLHQGSIQWSDLGKAFCADLASCFSHHVSRQQLDDAVLREAEKLAAEKYETAAWLRRH